MERGDEKMRTTEDAGLEPLKWNQRPGSLTVQLVRLTQAGRLRLRALPGGPRPWRSLRLQRLQRLSLALQVTQRHSHSDATTIAAITADQSRNQSRYDSDPLRAHPGSNRNSAPDSAREPVT
ncbi:hypothetical protein HispidOSU_000553 [Sigmodon hispidus]